jgi:hypothetical protein
MTRRVARVLGPMLGLVVLLMPAAQATAADDPGPVEWPKVEAPVTGGGKSDPAPTEWAKVEKPVSRGTASDPQPPEWPAPKPA